MPSTASTSRRTAMVDAYVAAVTGRRTKWVVVALGVVLAAALGPLAGKLGPLEKNSPAGFLPSGAASTEVASYLGSHGTPNPVPAVVVFARPGGLTATDRALVERSRALVSQRRLPEASAPSALRISANSVVATYEVPISAKASPTTIAADVKEIRAIVSAHASPGGGAGRATSLEVAVGGPAGSTADALDAFSGIDGKLLVVTVAVVALLLLLIYRSPILWLVPLVSVGLAAGWAQGAVYGLARAGFTVNGMIIGILSVLVFGAGTDYALLLVARYREELRRHDDHHRAVAAALRRAGPAIATSGATVILALLCLLVAQLSDIAALGPACAVGIACALVAQLAFLPALLAVVGRRAFWPFVPRPGAVHGEARVNLWGRLGRALARRPRPAWIGLTLMLGACAVGLLAYRGGVNQENGFRTAVGSVEAQQLLDVNFPGFDAAPAVVLVRRPGNEPGAAAAARATPGIASVGSPRRVGDAFVFDASLRAPPASASAEHTIRLLRQRLSSAAGPTTLVGGETATNLDLAAAAAHDRNLIVPLVVAVVAVMLGLLLRAVVAPLLLVASVILSYLASLGIGAVVFTGLFGFPGFDPSVPIFGFVFLVALGVDYNIFLMARAREEAVSGAVQGVVRALRVTGSVIPSAGVVLAATFAVLGVLPLVALTEVGFVVAFGVLVDTFLVRSALVPALAIDLGRTWWWPAPPLARNLGDRAPRASLRSGPGARQRLRR